MSWGKEVCKKTGFNDKRQALKTLRRIIRRSTNKTIPERAYLCDRCEKWHLTHMDNKEYSALNSKDVKLIYIDDWKSLIKK